MSSKNLLKNESKIMKKSADKSKTTLKSTKCNSDMDELTRYLTQSLILMSCMNWNVFNRNEELNLILIDFYFWNSFRLAIAEIERETQRAAARAEVVGASGWKPCPIPKTNKRFLSNTMRTVINHNRRTIQKNRQESQKRMSDLDKRKSKFGPRLHAYHSDNERLTKSKDEKKTKK